MVAQERQAGFDALLGFRGEAQAVTGHKALGRVQ